MDDMCMRRPEGSENWKSECMRIWIYIYVSVVGRLT